MSLREIRHLSKEMHACMAGLHQVNKRLLKLHERHLTGEISKEHLEESHSEKHEGRTKHEWVERCQQFIHHKSRGVHHHLNHMVGKPADPRMLAILLVVLSLGILSLMTPTLIGLVVGGSGTVTLDQTFTHNEILPLGISGLANFWISGDISAGFSGRILLEDGSSRYVVYDSRVSIQNESVQGATLLAEFQVAHPSPEVTAITPTGIQSEKMCAVYTYQDTRACNGDSSCCFFMNAKSADPDWNATFYLNSLKSGAKDRNIVTAQIVFANYSLDPKDAFSDIRYSDKRQFLADLFDRLRFDGVCGGACTLRGSKGPYTLIIEVESGNITLSNYTYLGNRNLPPTFTDIPNLTVLNGSTLELDLSKYVTDPEGDPLTFDFYAAPGINITFNGTLATITLNATPVYTFFTVKDESSSAVSNLIELSVSNEVKPWVVVGQDVRWVKRVTVSGRKIVLEEGAQNISVSVGGLELDDSDLSVIDDNKIQDLEEYELEQEWENTQDDLRSGSSNVETEKNLRILETRLRNARISGGMKRLVSAGITGNAVLQQALPNETLLVLPIDATEADIEYYTPAPEATETSLPTGKRVTISSDIHYTDILAFATIPNTEPERISLYQLVNGDRIKTVFDGYDTDGDAKVDYLEWTVPHLSNQTYDIILVAHAEHLDANMSFIQDITSLVVSRDSNWTSWITPLEYVRARFEYPLSNGRDITVYARSNDTTTIDVYLFNSTQKVLSLGNITSEGFYKAYFSMLNGSFDTFDLQIMGNGAIQFDLIVDPIINITNITALGSVYYQNTLSADGLPILHALPNDSSLIFYAPFDANQTQDNRFSSYALNNSIGTCTGTACPIYNLSGKFGAGMYFDGGDNITFGNISAIANMDGKTQLTLSCWMFPSASRTGTSEYCLTIKQDGPGGQATFIRKQGTSPRFAISINNGGGVTMTGTCGTIVSDSWNHLVGTYNGTNMVAYVNGINCSSNSETRTMNMTGVVVETTLGGSGLPLLGQMDEVSVYNRSLTATEVQLLYNQTLPRFYPQAAAMILGNVSVLGNNTINVTMSSVQPNASGINISVYSFNGSYRDNASEALYDPSIVAWYHFDNRSGENASQFKDWSGKEKNGTCSGTACPTYNVSGKYHSAYSFDGTNDVINLPDIDFPTGNFSLSFLFQATPSVIFGPLLRKTDGTTDHWIILKASGAIEASIDDGTDRGFETISTGYNDGKWHNLLMNVDTTSMYIYMDAILIGNVSHDNSLDVNDAAWMLGGDTFNGEYLRTQIDEVMIFNRTLTQAEIQAIYAGQALRYFPQGNAQVLPSGALQTLTFNISNTTLLPLVNISFAPTTYSATAYSTITLTTGFETPVTPPFFGISFVSPTPANASLLGTTYALINFTVNSTNLSAIQFDWNGTNTTVFNDSLVLFMNFDNRSQLGENNSQVADLSKYETNATCSGSTCPTFSGTGKYGGVYTYDGTEDYFNISGTKVYADSAIPFSFSAWFYLNILGTNESGTNNFPVIFRLRSSGASPYDVFFSNVSGYRGINIGSDDTFSRLRANISDSLLVGSWQHLVVVYTGVDSLSFGNYTIYLNGVPQAIYNSSNYAAATQTSKIGGTAGSANEHWDGSIDDVQIYNRSLSTQEIRQLYQTSVTKYSPNFYSIVVNQTNLTNGAYFYQAHAQDIPGRRNQTERRVLTVGLSAPDVPTIIFPRNMTVMQKGINMSINFTSTDSDGDAITYYGYINKTLNFTSSGNITVWNASGGFYILNISAYDGFFFSANATANFTVAPNNAPNSPTIHFPNSGGFIKIGVNMTINFSSSDPEFDDITYFGYVNKSLNFTTTTNITSWNASDGFYHINISAYDGAAFSANTSFTVTVVDSGINFWTCSLARTFDNASCWSLGRIPRTGDMVIFNGSGTGNVNITNNTMPQNLSSFMVAPGYTGNITFWKLFSQGTWSGNGVSYAGSQNWNVTGPINISGGTMGIYGDYPYNITSEGSGQSWKSLTGNITIETGVTLDGIDRGFSVNTGPGSDGGPGLHGGIVINRADLPYGNATAPRSLGSGGDTSDGGGAIYLSSAHTVQVNGRILMNATEGINHRGAGGAIWLEAPHVIGNGTLSAVGGSSNNGGSPGSGGRIRLGWGESLRFTGKIDLVSGRTSAANLDRLTTSGTLTFTNNTWPGDWNLTGKIGLLGGDFGEGNVTQVRGYFNTRGFDMDIYSDCFNSGASPLPYVCYNSSNGGAGVWINATGNITIASGSHISGQDLGFNATIGPGFGSGDSSAAHGGRTTNSANVYGNNKEPTTIGSGGTSLEDASPSAIKLETAGDIVVRGDLLFSGRTGNNWRASGGSIWLKSSRVEGNGTLNATGGVSGNGGEGGGGGRIAITADVIDFNGSANTFGGTSSNQNNLGYGGTIFINATSSISGVFNTTAFGYSGGNITLHDTLITVSGRYNATGIVSTAGNISFTYTNCLSTFTGVYSPSATYYDSGCTAARTMYWICSSPRTFDNASCWSGGRAPIPGDSLIFNGSGTGDVNITNSTMPRNLSSFFVDSGYTGIITFWKLFANGSWAGNGVSYAGSQEWNVTGDINISGGTLMIHGDYPFNISREGFGQSWRSVNGNITIGAGAILDGRDFGFSEDAGPGYNGPQTSGSHGGTGNSGGGPYGNASAPTSLGSGGDSSAGGSAIKLEAYDKISIRGIINMSVYPMASKYMGAGGSIWLKAPSIQLLGSIAAMGGASTNDVREGGGGRIRLEYGQQLIASGSISVAGGDETSKYGKTGTFTFTNNTWPGNWTVNGTIGLLGGNMNDGNITQVRGNFRIPSGSRISVFGDCFFGIAYVSCYNRTRDGRGVWINATGNITIESGALVEGIGTGLPNEVGPGTNPLESYEGGSYGGIGGNDPGVAYGNITGPMSLGSGGGSGFGGGAVRLETADTIVINGIIDMRGGTSDFSGFGAEHAEYIPGYGGGSGGSIWLKATTIAGTGNLSARGGDNYRTNQGGGGGGGRIALTGTNILYNGSIMNIGGIDSYQGGLLTEGSGGSVYVSGASQIVSKMNVSVVGRDAETGLGQRINFTTTYLFLAGTYNASVWNTSEATYNPGNITLTYTDCSSRYLNAIFSPNPSLQSSCELINVTSPVNGTLYTVPYISFEVSTSRLGSWCGYSLDSATNVSMQSLTSTSFNFTNSSMADGPHSVIFTCNDTFNIFERSGTYTFTVNATYPFISFAHPTPANRSTFNTPMIVVNVSSSENSGFHSVVLDFNRTLLGWWRFNNETGENNSQFKDFSTYGRNATCSGTTCPVYNATATLGLSTDFDGTDDILVINATDCSLNMLNESQPMAIAAWILNQDVAGGPGGSDVQAVISCLGNSGNGNPGDFFFGVDTSGRLQFDHWSVAGADATGAVRVNTGGGGTTIADNTWYHVAASWNGTNTSLHINGVAQPLNSPSTTGSGHTAGTRIGAMNTGLATYFWQGNIDEVAVFRRALSSVEVGAMNDASTKQYRQNFTLSTQGRYTLQAYAQNALGHITETGISEFVFDTTPPQISFVLPTPPNATITKNSSIIVNVTSNDTLNTHETLLDFNRTLVGWWRLNNESGENSSQFKDASSWQNNGTCSGTSCPTVNFTGRFGRALNFDGVNDNITIIPTGALNATGNMLTISLWLSARTIGTTMEGGIISKSTSGMTQYHISKVGTGAINFSVTTANGISWVNITPSPALLNNSWTHIVGVYNTTNLTLFINGVYQGATNATGTVLNSNSSIVLGRHGNWHLNGSIDDVQIYSRALSSLEVLSLFNATAYPYISNQSFASLGNYTYQAFAQDHAGNVNQTEERTIWRIPETFPSWQNNLTNDSSKISETKLFSVYWTDDLGLSRYTFSWNGSGSWVNDSSAAFATNPGYSNASKTIVLTRGNTIGWQVFANDTSGNMNSTDIFTFVVENTAPLAVNLSYPLNGSTLFNRTPRFNWTSAYDADGDTVTYTLLIDESNTCIETGKECLISTINATSISTIYYSHTSPLAVYTYYNWTVQAFDGFNYSFFSSSFNFSINKTLPGISFVSPTPTNQSSVRNMSVAFNVTSNDTLSQHSVIMDFNRSLVGWWRFNNASGENDSQFKDFSTYEQNASCSGTVCPNYSTVGKLGKALQFDGVDDYVNVTDTGALNLSNDYTTSVWVYINTTQVINATIYAKTTDGVNGAYALQFDNSSPRKLMVLHDNGYSGNVFDTLITNNSLNRAWHHIATRRRGTTMTAYLDGAEQVSGSFATAPSPGAGVLRIGEGRILGSPWNGLIDDLQIYRRALTDVEILAIVNATSNRYQLSLNLSDAVYTVKAYAQDLYGNVNDTGTTTFTIDQTPPSIQFVYPTPENGTKTNAYSMIANVSSFDSISEHSVTFDFNRSLLGWYRFNNETGENGTYFRDSSAYARNATCSGSACPVATSGKLGSMLNLDGSNDLVNLSTFADNLSEMTVMAWVNSTYTGNYAPIVGKMSRTSDGAGWFFGLHTGTTVFVVQQDGGNWNQRDTVTLNASNGRPHHIAATLKGGLNGAIQIYIDGQSVSVTNPSSGSVDTASTTQSVTIGHLGEAPYYLSAGIDDVQIYNRALNISEIRTHYNASVTQYQNDFNLTREGSYTFAAYAQDLSGNINTTGTREITVDRTLPQIAFVFPTPPNNSVNGNLSIIVNVTSNDTSGSHTVIVDFNRTLVGWWRLNNESGENSSQFKDFSAFGNNGTCVGTACPTISISGKLGGGLLFDGIADGVNLSALSLSSLGITNKITVSAWAKTTNAAQTDQAVIVRGQTLSGAQNTSFSLSLTTSSSLARFSVGDGSTVLLTDASSAISANTWYHLVGVLDDDVSYLYVNGALVKTNSSAGFGNILDNLPLSGPNTGIGFTPYFPNDSFLNGFVDEVQIYSRALNATEVLSLYNASATPYSRNFTLGNYGNYSIKAYSQDFAGNLNETGEWTFERPIGNYPIWQNNLTNSSNRYGQTKFFSVNWTDDTGLSMYIFSWNGTSGSWQNDTPVVFTGYQNYSNTSKVIGLAPGNTIGWRVYANDTVGLMNMTDLFTFQVLPPNIWNCTTGIHMFTNASCWSLGRAPITGDEVIFTSPGLASVNITNNTMPQNLESFFVNTTYTETLHFTPLFAVGNWTGRNDGSQIWNLTQNIQINGGTVNIWGDVRHIDFTGQVGNISAEGHGQEWQSLFGNITIGTAAKIEGKGLGFLNQSGPGKPNGYSTSGIHAGWSAYPYIFEFPYPYGNASAPTSLGSGGTTTNSCGYGSSAIKLTSDNLLINGAINMSGPVCNGYPGAGGSIFVRANNISGIGWMQADGGPSLGSGTGNGGRIRIEYLQSLTYTGVVSVNGTFVGTLTFTNNTWPGDWNLTGGIGLLGGNYGEGNITQVRGSFNTKGKNLQVYGDCTIATADRLLCYNNVSDGRGVFINASGNINISANSLINGIGLGFPNKTGPGAGYAAYIGASYGGKGYNTYDGMYGGETEPISLGSGGGNMQGGSAIRLESQSNVYLDGEITVAGFSGTNLHPGSGGSIYVRANAIKGAGQLIASGGGSDLTWSGGGRISLSSSSFVNFTGTINNTGGIDLAGRSYAGSGGTLYINATLGVVMTLNASSIGWNGTSGLGQTINITAPYISIGGVYNASRTNSTLTDSTNDGKITLTYTDCTSTFNNAIFSPDPLYLTSCTLALNITSPLNTSNFNNSALDFNVTTSRIGNSCSYSLDGGANVSMSMFSAQRFNFTNVSIAQGAHYVNFYCNDTTNNKGDSGPYMFTIDTVYPNIAFVHPTPANATITTQDTIYVNISANDTNNVSMVIDFDDSLVSWWRFDDIKSNGNVADYMGRNVGSPSGGPYQTSAGRAGKAMVFDGTDDYIQSDLGSVNLTKTQQGTIAVWFNMPVECGGADKRFVTLEDDNDFWIGCTFTQIRASVWDGQNTRINSDTNFSNFLNKWVFVTTTFGNSTMKLYINGIPNGTVTIGNFSYETPNGQRTVKIGSTGNGAAGFFYGSIDDVMIFNRSLSSAEILALYGNQSSTYLAKNFTNLTAGAHRFKAYTQDIAGNINSTEQRIVTYTAFGSPPQWQNNLSNSSMKIDETKFFSVNWTDDLGLSAYIFSWNGSSGAWQNNSPVAFIGLQNYSNVSKIINLSRGNTIGWRVYANDTGNQWNQTDIFTFVVANTPPYPVNLSSPLNTSNITDRFPIFNWSAAYDPDGDLINYTITIDEWDSCSGNGLECIIFNVNTTVFNRTFYNHTNALGIDTYYNWTVIANDGFDSSSVSGMFNFSLNGVLSMTLSCSGCNDRSDFGDAVIQGQMYNTTQNSPLPIIVENNGNVLVRISLNATPLWQSVSFNNIYYQYQAGNSSEANSFNWSNSTTIFTNMNENLTHVIGMLNFSNISNRAEIELRIRIPDDELAGKKTTTINIEGRYNG